MKYPALVLLSFLSLNVFAQWTDLSSARQDITFVNETTGWMAGDDGSLMKTTDGGKTWLTQNSPVVYNQEHITRIFAFDGGNVLKVVTNNGKWLSPMGIIYISTDAGNTWKQVVNKNYTYIDAHFISASIGWYWASYVGDGTPMAYSTSDGGNTWTEISAFTHPCAITSFGDNVWALQRVNDKSFIWISHDLGATWSVTEIQQYFDGKDFIPTMQFLDAQNGWMSTGLAKPYRTTDGGRTWTEVTHETLKNVTVRKILFVNLNEGYALGMDSWENQQKILKTTDGGTSWSMVHKSAGYEIEKKINVLYTKGENHLIAAGNSGLYLETKDGGSTWSIVNFCTVGASYPAVDLTFNGTDIWVVGENLVQTSKDGVQWTIHDGVIDNHDYEENMIAFADNGKGIIAGDIGFSGTTDHGATWSSYVPKQDFTSDYYNNRIWHDRYGNYWLMKPNATLFKSDDGGQTFKIVFKPSGLLSSNREMAFQSKDKVWYYGESRLFKSKDAGKTWVQSSEAIDALQFISEDIGWKLTSQKNIYKTIDGGERWTLVSTLTHWTPFKFIYFADENVGWAASTLGAIFKTVNGGKKWTNEYTSVLNDYNDIAFTTNAEGKVIGYLGGDGLLQLNSNYLPQPVISFGELTTTITAASATFVKLSWTDNSNVEDGFIIQRKLAGGVFADLSAVTSTTFTDNTVEVGKTYVYRVAAYKTNRAIHYSNEVNILVSAADVVAPAIIETQPQTGAFDVDPATPLTIVFNEPIQLVAGSLTIHDASTNEVLQTYTLDQSITNVEDGTLSIVLPGSLPTGKHLYVKIGENTIRDIAGNFFQGLGNDEWDFTIAAPVDHTAPAGVSFFPAPGSVDVAAATNLSVSFDETIILGDGLLTIYNATSDALLASYTLDESICNVSGNTLTITLPELLPEGKGVYVKLQTGTVQDLAANSFEGIDDKEWFFFIESTITALEKEIVPLQVSSDGVDIRIVGNGVMVTHVNDILGRPLALERSRDEVTFRKIDGVIIISGMYQGRKFTEKLISR